MSVDWAATRDGEAIGGWAPPVPDSPRPRTDSASAAIPSVTTPHTSPTPPRAIPWQSEASPSPSRKYIKMRTGCGRGPSKSMVSAHLQPSSVLPNIPAPPRRNTADGPHRKEVELKAAEDAFGRRKEEEGAYDDDRPSCTYAGPSDNRLYSTYAGPFSSSDDLQSELPDKPLSQWGKVALSKSLDFNKELITVQQGETTSPGSSSVFEVSAAMVAEDARAWSAFGSGGGSSGDGSIGSPTMTFDPPIVPETTSLPPKPPSARTLPLPPIPLPPLPEFSSTAITKQQVKVGGRWRAAAAAAHRLAYPTYPPHPPHPPKERVPAAEPAPQKARHNRLEPAASAPMAGQSPGKHGPAGDALWRERATSSYSKPSGLPLRPPSQYIRPDGSPVAGKVNPGERKASLPVTSLGELVAMGDREWRDARAESPPRNAHCRPRPGLSTAEAEENTETYYLQPSTLSTPASNRTP